MVIIGIILLIGFGVITKNQCEIGDKLDEANRLNKQRNEILKRK